jgi:AcrR family transcriptional regulator
MLDLLERGVLRPTVKDVAVGAGVSERAVFRHFQDTDSLHLAVAELQVRRIASRVPPLPEPEASLRERIAGIVARWTAVNELVTPVRRSANTLAPFSAEIARRHEWMRSTRKVEIRQTFKEELARFDRRRRADVLLIVDWALAWSTWEHHRRYGGASIARARRVVTKLVANEFA